MIRNDTTTSGREGGNKQQLTFIGHLHIPVTVLSALNIRIHLILIKPYEVLLLYSFNR